MPFAIRKPVAHIQPVRRRLGRVRVDQAAALLAFRKDSACFQSLYVRMSSAAVLFVVVFPSVASVTAAEERAASALGLAGSRDSSRLQQDWSEPRRLSASKLDRSERAVVLVPPGVVSIAWLARIYQARRRFADLLNAYFAGLRRDVEFLLNTDFAL